MMGCSDLLNDRVDRSTVQIRPRSRVCYYKGVHDLTVSGRDDVEQASLLAPAAATLPCTAYHPPRSRSLLDSRTFAPSPRHPSPKTTIAENK